MKMMEKILLPTDFSPTSQSAMEMAITVAKKFDSEIILLHVLPDIPKSKLVEDMLNKTAHDQFKTIRKKISRSRVKMAEPIIATGNHFDQIIQLAKKRDVNLIIMGSGEKEGSEKPELGNTAKKVIRKSGKPVWIMKRDMHSNIKRIICPIDFSEPSRRALNNAIHLARGFQAELTVMTVIAPLTNRPLGLDVQLTSEQQMIAEEQTFRFDNFLKKFDFHDVKLLMVIYQGKPYQEILKRLHVHKNDLLIMGTAGRTGFNRLLKGSVTEKVTRGVPCSFITMKSEHVIRLRLERKISNMETHFSESKQLLAKGFAKEALHQIQICLKIDCLSIPAWEGMAKVHDRLGHKEKAMNCRNKVKEIRERFWQQQVEFDIRRRHRPFRYI